MTTSLATGPQVSFLQDLLAKRAYVTSDFTDVLSALADGTLTKEDATHAIGVLKSAPRATSTATAPRSTEGLDVGMYRRQSDGEIFRIHRSRETGNLYAKRLDLLATGAEFSYAAGAIYTLTPADRMTLDEAKAWGVSTGICCVCGAFLTDPKSVSAGIGPICSGRV